MAEVGVLNLTIRDNSEQAAAGLGSLVDALKRVRGAVKNGLDMSGVAKGIESFGKAVDDSIHGSTLSKISQLTESLSKMSGMGPIHLHIKDTGVEDTARSFSGIQKSSRGVKTDLENVASAINKVKNAAAGGIGGHGMAGIARSLTSAATNLESNNVAGTFKKVANAIEMYVSAYSKLEMLAFTPNDFSPGKMMKVNLSQFGENPTENIEGLKNVESTVQSAVSEQVENSVTSSVIENVQEQVVDTENAVSHLQTVTEDVNETIDDTFGSGASEKINSFFGGLKKAISDIGSPLTGLVKQFARIAKYRMLRNVLKHISAGFKEGINNVYEYSKAVGTSFAPTMDSLKSTLAQFKNSLGAALAPALEALIPLLNSIVNAAIPVINALNQIFSLLAGKTSWTSATSATKSIDNIGKAAGGASDSMKEMLASFDELNVIASQSGGGGGSSGTDVTGMFGEENGFDSGIVDFVNWLNDNLESILGIAVAIETALLAWKFGNAFMETVPVLSQLFGLIATGAAIAITLQLTWLLTNQYLNTGNEGWLIAEIFTTAVGATAAASIAKHFIGGNAGAWVAAITLTFSALTGIKAVCDNADVGALSKESLVTLVVNALKVGAAAGILLKTVGNSTMLVASQGAAGVALIVFGAAVGIKAICDDNIEVFSQESVVSGIISAASVGLGVAVLGGGWAIAAGAAIATFAAYIGIKALTSSNKITVDDNLVTLTEAQVKVFVEKKMFSVDPNLMIDIAKDNVSMSEKARENIESKLKLLLGTFEVVNLGLATDNDYKTIKDQITGNGGLIDSIVNYINTAEETSKLVLKFTPQLVGEDEDSQGAWYTGNIAGWETVKEYVRGLGKELADNIVEGENDELIVKRPERVAAILDEINQISNIIAGTDISTEAEIDLSLKLEDLDSSSFNAVMQEYGNYKEQMREAARQIEETAYANQVRLVNALTKMVELDPNNAELKAQLEEAKEGLETIKANLQDNIDKTFEDISAPGKTMLQEWVEKNFDPNSVQILWDQETLESMIHVNGFKETLEQIFTTNGMDMTEIDINDLLEVGGWDLLTTEMQNRLIEHLKVHPEDIADLKTAFDASELISLVHWNTLSYDMKFEFLNALIDAFGAEEALQAAEEAGINVDRLLRNGLEAGTPEVQETARDIMDKINKEVNDNPPVIPDAQTPNGFGNAAKKVVSSAVTGIKNVVTDVTIKLPEIQKPATTYGNTAKKVVSSAASGIKKVVTGLTMKLPEIVKPAKTYGSTAKEVVKSAATGIKKVVTGLTMNLPEIVKPAKTYGNTAKEVVSNAASGIKKVVTGTSLTLPDITVQADVGTAAKVAISTAAGILQGVANACAIKIPVGLKSDGSTLQVHVTGGGGGLGTVSLQAMAKGGFVDTGTLFLAGEAGPEVVGTIGGHTAVANQDQIVSGIEKGVRDANTEQNNLLRQQNELLRRILEKEMNVNIGASARFGQTAKKSIDMYNALVGG